MSAAADYADALGAVATLLAYVGEDVSRTELMQTPRRYVRALEELTRGYSLDPADVLVTFDSGCDEMVVVGGIPFTSLCEHHVLPFTGTVTIGYVPRMGRIVGLSKLPRLVEVYAARLQLQERMTQQIATALLDHLDPLGVAVVVEARHSCMSNRGVRSAGITTTSATLGVFRDKPEARAEFMALHREHNGR